MALKSVHNTTMEGFWCWLREKIGHDIKAHPLQAKDIITMSRSHGTGRFYSPPLCTSRYNLLFRDLFYWVFPPLAQAKLDEFVGFWNNHRI